MITSVNVTLARELARNYVRLSEWRDKYKKLVRIKTNLNKMRIPIGFVKFIIKKVERPEWVSEKELVNYYYKRLLDNWNDFVENGRIVYSVPSEETKSGKEEYYKL